MGVVGYGFYSTVYGGTDVDEASFPALCARALDVIGALTHWKVDNDNIAALPALHRTLYRKAVCAQADYFAVNGTDSVNGTGSAGFTVGKVTVQGGNKAANGGRMAEHVSPLAVSYLEQTGLMNPQIATAGWW